MSTPYEVPLTPLPQSFSIDLGATTYKLTVRLNGAIDVWMLDIADINGVAILLGIPIVTGCDLLEQYGYLKFGGKLIVQTDNDPFAAPTPENLGLQSHLYFVTTP